MIKKLDKRQTCINSKLWIFMDTFIDLYCFSYRYSNQDQVPSISEHFPPKTISPETCAKDDSNLEECGETCLKTEICKICDKPFTDAKFLEKHLSSVHLVQSKHRFQCALCSKTYTKNHDLTRHLRNKHDLNLGNSKTNKSSDVMKFCFKTSSGKKLFYCDFCPKVFNKGSNLLRHRTMHSDFKAFCCSLCGKNFRLNASLTRHIKEVHQEVRSFKCPICQKEFKNKYSLDEHSNIHSDNRPYVCKVCGKGFRQNASLFIHNQYHAKNELFQCNICQKTFNTKHNVKRHILCHSQQKEFSCQVCAKQFSSRQGLYKHQKLHHMQKVTNNVNKNE